MSVSKRLRALTVAVACVFALCTLLCAVWVSLNVRHVCIDEDCMICARLDAMESVWKRLLATCAAGICLSPLALYLTVRLIATAYSAPERGTLVSLKVKLSD